MRSNSGNYIVSLWDQEKYPLDYQRILRFKPLVIEQVILKLFCLHNVEPSKICFSLKKDNDRHKNKNNRIEKSLSLVNSDVLNWLHSFDFHAYMYNSEKELYSLFQFKKCTCLFTNVSRGKETKKIFILSYLTDLFRIQCCKLDGMNFSNVLKTNVTLSNEECIFHCCSWKRQKWL